MCMYPMIDFYCESIDAAELTVAHYEETLERIFKQLEEFGVKLQTEAIVGISGAVLQRWLNATKKGRKPATVNNYIVTLNPFLRWAHKIYPSGVGDFGNILKTIKLPTYEQLSEDERPKEKYYSDEQIEELLRIPKPYEDSPLKKRDRAIIALFLASGLRVSELCQLKIGSLTDHGHGYVFVKRKGGAWKTTEVAEFAYPYIETYLETRKDRDNPSAPLFMTINGTPCNRQQLYYCLRNRQKKVTGGDEMQFGCHTFRHTFVSSVEKIGGGAVARDLANHKSLTITNRYDHSTAGQRRSAVDALNYGL